MPSTITHAYIGLDTMKKLNPKPKKLLTNNVNNFKIYCQGTDILYFYRIFLLKTNKIQKVGHTFHNYNTFNIFNYLITINKENKDPELFTFVSGLVTHYKADSLMHPFINYLSHSDKRLERLNNHFLIESYIDNYFINKKEKIDYYKYRLDFKYNKQEIIAKTLNNLFKKYFKMENIGNLYYKSLKSLIFTYRHVRYDPHGIKKNILTFIDYNKLPVRRTKYLSYNFKLDNDTKYLNLNNNRWFNYKDKSLSSNKSYLELYEQVTEESANIINKLYLYIFENKELDLYKLIGNYSYSTGLELPR